jgi:hypothetical protein
MILKLNKIKYGNYKSKLKNCYKGLIKLVTNKLMPIKYPYYNKKLNNMKLDFLIKHSNTHLLIMIIKQPKYSKEKLFIN